MYINPTVILFKLLRNDNASNLIIHHKQPAVLLRNKHLFASYPKAVSAEKIIIYFLYHRQTSQSPLVQHTRRYTRLADVEKLLKASRYTEREGKN